MTFGHVGKNGSIRKIKSDFKIHDVKQLQYISRSKGNQAMKFCQLIENNMRYIFAEKSLIKCVGETIPRPLSEKSKLSISLDQ